MEIDNKKHILFLPEWYPNPDDPQLAVFVEKFARAAAMNSKVSLIYCGPFAKNNKIDLILKKEGNLTSYFCYYPKQKRKLRAYNYFIKAHQMCFDKLKEDGIPDLIHLHMLFRNYVAYKKIYAVKIKKFLITEQWSGYIDGTFEKLGYFKKREYKQAFSKAYFVTAVSKKLADALNKKFDIQNNILILPNIAEASINKNSTKTEQFNLLVVADLVDKIKNVSGVIEAYIQSNLEIKSVLTIIGDGTDRIELENKARSLNSPNKEINFKGRLENKHVLEEMQLANCLITNSRHETFSMVTAEALLAGLPVICTKCGGPEEFVNENNGILINVDDVKALKLAIEKMAISHTKYNPAHLSKPVLDKFGIMAVSKQLNDIYTNILNP